MNWKQRFKQHRVGALAGAAIAILLGLLCWLPLGDGLTRWSYDLLYLFRADMNADEVVLVYLDDQSHIDLKQEFGKAWDRELHARLVDRLAGDKAKAVVFDVVFSDAQTNTAAGAKLVEAIRRNGKVVLSGLILPTEDHGLQGEKLNRPAEALRQAAVGWGIANFESDPDQVNRKLSPGSMDFPSLAWAVAEAAEAPLARTPERRMARRWLNYYGPPGVIVSASYSKALAPGEISSDFFRDRIVFIGERPTAGYTGEKREEVPTPFTWRTGKNSPKVDIHATAFLNLLHGNWLRRMPAPVEILLLVMFGLVLGCGLALLEPMAAAGVAAASAVVVATGAWVFTWQLHVWSAWLLLAVVQIPAAFVWSVTYNSVRLYVQRQKLEQSLALYLSPARAKEVMNSPELLQPGVKRVEVSILFSDIASFSKLSESLPAEDLAKQLNGYYETALACVHDTNGTVMKLIGDAIFAIWNAPVAQADHQERTCRAALLLAEKLETQSTSRHTMTLSTRVGIHSGVACVGNVGSTTRFDYTAVGDSINLASRLEGLNKHLDTQILASRDIQKAIEGRILSREIGLFKFKGFGRNVQVYELIGGGAKADLARPWIEAFESGLARFKLKQFDAAEREFQRTIELRQVAEQQQLLSPEFRTQDGPCRFYLKLINQFRVKPPWQDWIGEISMDEK